MKKSFISLGLIVAATFALTNCAKELENPSQQPESAGIPFEITASTPDTKTANDGYNTVWVADDAINLFHAVADAATYVNDGEFTVAAADVDAGRFTGTLGGDLDAGKSYDWYAFYPYSEYTTTPANTSGGRSYIGCRSDKSQAQVGLDNMKHIAGANYPMYGYARSVSADAKPTIDMTHVSSLIEIVVTNTLSEDLNVENISFTAPEDIVGNYYVNFAGEECTFTKYDTFQSNTANLTVSDAVIPAGKKGKFYLAVKPFTAPSGSELSLSVNGYNGNGPLTMTKDVTFAAGKIKTLNFAYDKVVSGKSVTFDFTKTTELEALGIALPDAGDGTNISALSLVKEDITITSTDGSTASRIWNSAGSYDLRMYKNATMTIKATSGYVITSVTITGGTIDAISKSTIPSNPVVLTISSTASTQKISTITVEYEEGEVEKVPLTMTAIECTQSTTNSLSFSWSDVFGAAGYKVSTDGGITYGDVITETEYTWDGLNPDTDYTLYVKAIGNGMNTSDSDPVSCIGTTAEAGASVVVYTFETEKSTTNTAYANTYDLTINGVQWSVPGNQNFDGYVRIGGKSLNNAIRVIYSKTAISDNISKIEMSTNGISNASLTVNSITLKVFKNAADAASQSSTPLTTIVNTDADWSKSTPKTITFSRPNDTDWSNCFYRLEFNLTNTNTSSNYGVDLQEMDFYN